MKRLAMIMGALALSSALSFGEDITHPTVFKDDVNFDRGCIWKIDSTKVTSSASELNILDGCTATAAQLNSAASGNIAVGRLTNAADSLGPNIGGNLPVASITNAAGSVGSSIGGNIPKASITNALGTAGSSMGGNLPFATVTNMFTNITGTWITNTCVANLAGTVTNTYVFAPVGGSYVLKTITTSP